MSRAAHVWWRVQSVVGLAKSPRRFGVVVEGKIYRSGRIDPVSLQWVAQQSGIKTVVDLGAFVDGSAEDRAIAEAAEALGLKRYVFRLRGTGAGDPQRYVDALRVLRDESAYPVLVHCAAGAQRTGACVLLYRHLFEGEPVREAYRETIECGHPAGEWRLLAYIAENMETIRQGVNKN
jgi:protein tyrosine/serine phosphatase